MPKTVTKKPRKVAAQPKDKAVTPIMVEKVAPSAVTTNSPYSFTSLVDFLNNNFSLILLVGIFFILGFIVGSLWTENQVGKSQALKAGTPTQVADDTAPQGPTEDQLKKMPKVTKDDHIRGNINAKILLVEYSDYECPFCNRFHPTMQQVMKEYGDKVAWVYRHYPLPFHPEAQRSGETAECVAEIGGSEAFWKFSDSVYEEVATKGSDALKEDNLKVLANKAGANGDKVIDCAKSGKMADKVKKNMTEGSAAGISGTPGTIIVAGDKYELIPGALPFEQVKAQIDALLK